MDFSDQIALAARLAARAARGRRGRAREVPGGAARRVPGHLGRPGPDAARLFSGPDAEHGRGHPVTAVGDPNQAIYGWRGASVSNILGFGERLPRRRRPVDAPTYPLTVNRRSDARILDVANRLAAPLYDATSQAVGSCEPAPQAAPRRRSGVAVHETYDDELAWLAGAGGRARRSDGRRRPGARSAS